MHSVVVCNYPRHGFDVSFNSAVVRLCHSAASGNPGQLNHQLGAGDGFYFDRLIGICDFTHPFAAIGSKRLPQHHKKRPFLISQKCPLKENGSIRLPKVLIVCGRRRNGSRQDRSRDPGPIVIRSPTMTREAAGPQVAAVAPQLTDIRGIGKARAKQLVDIGIDSVEKLAASSPQTVARIKFIRVEMASKLVAEAKSLIAVS